MRTQELLLLPHVGQLLGDFYSTSNANRGELPRALRRARKRVQTYESRPTLPCKLLWEISVVLGHNFFEDIARQLPESFTTAVPKDDGQARRISELEEENRMLKVKLDLLKEVMRK